MQKVLMYTRFERFWHWTQALAIILLAVTGFEVRGFFNLFGFEKAVQIHEVTGVAMIVLIIFAIFWHFTTGEWKQYIPTHKKLIDQVLYYLVGIFKGDLHPVNKTREAKFNPLQRLVYLGLKITLFPPQIILGLLYLFYYDLRPVLPEFVTLELIANAHVLFAFVFIHFLVIHIYMTTTGETITSNIKAMITGYEDLHDESVDK